MLYHLLYSISSCYFRRNKTKKSFFGDGHSNIQQKGIANKHGKVGLINACMKTCHVQCTSCSNWRKKQKAVVVNAFTVLGWMDRWMLLILLSMCYCYRYPLTYHFLRHHTTTTRVFIILSRSQTRIQSVPVPQLLCNIEGGGKLTREQEHVVIVIIIAMVHITFASNFSQKMGKGMSHIMCYCSLFSEIPNNQNQP